MRVVFCIALLVALASAEFESEFSAFKAKHGKTYATPMEEATRFGIFQENMRVAAGLSAINPQATFGASRFADLTAEEFKQWHNADAHFASLPKNGKTVSMDRKIGAGQKIDWRTKGAVTAVKNQGQCGSCWSFSTTGNIEGQWALAGNTLVALSEQELVSCDTNDSGCQGGLMDNAFKWLISAKDGWIDTEASWPYVSGGGSVPACSSDSSHKKGAQIYSYHDITKTEDDMASYCFQNGPVSIGVDATSWQTYIGGIMTNCISNQVDHGVLIVGFDDTASTPYWIIKNSWAASWGEEGYIRVAKGSDQCMITYAPSSSLVQKSGPNPPPSPTPGPGPVPPTPPTPGATFEQLYCTEPHCKNCKTVTLPQAKCIVSGDYSFIAQCEESGLRVLTFDNQKCSGKSSESLQPIDVCEIDFRTPQGPTFLENKCRRVGPTPPNPPPNTPAPVAPQPTPSGATFTQKTCTDSACTEGCTSHSFPQNQCLRLSSGGSAIVTCGATSLNVKEYPLSDSCQGFSLPTTQPINTCEQDTSGTYFENLCSSGMQHPMGSHFVHSAKLDARLGKMIGKK